VIRELRYTLVSDGSSNDALIPPLTWLLEQQGVACAIQPTWADLSRLRPRPKGLGERIRSSLALYPCDLLFVHRDAENQEPASRRAEILTALEAFRETLAPPPFVCVIPVRMMEAWLLFDERGLRWVAGNPNGTMALDLPRLADLEHRPDPKDDLHERLRIASGLHGRRLKRFSTTGSARRIADRLDTFAPLRILPAFQALEADISQVIQENGWGGRFRRNVVDPPTVEEPQNEIVRFGAVAARTPTFRRGAVERGGFSLSHPSRTSLADWCGSCTRSTLVVAGPFGEDGPDSGCRDRQRRGCESGSESPGKASGPRSTRPVGMMTRRSIGRALS
jgi:hypothetical protein